MALVAVAGYVDAVGFVRFGELFVSFMSGNSLQLAILPVVGRAGVGLLSGGLVLLFVMGVFAGRLIETAAGAWASASLLSLVAALLALGAGAGVVQASALLGVSLGATTLAMGLLNAMPRPDHGPTVSLTYVSGALVRLGRALADAVSGRAETPWAVYLLNWLMLVLGAALGGLAAVRFGMGALLVAAAFTALLALRAGALVRRTQPRSH